MSLWSWYYFAYVGRKMATGRGFVIITLLDNKTILIVALWYDLGFYVTTVATGRNYTTWQLWQSDTTWFTLFFSFGQSIVLIIENNHKCLWFCSSCRSLLKSKTALDTKYSRNRNVVTAATAAALEHGKAAMEKSSGYKVCRQTLVITFSSSLSLLLLIRKRVFRNVEVQELRKHSD